MQGISTTHEHPDRTRRWRADRAYRQLVSMTAIVVIAALAGVRVATNGEFAFASLSLLPVVIVAWWSGRASGLGMAAFAAAAWLVGDLQSTRSFSASWIPWVNGVTHLLTYGAAAWATAQLRLLFDDARDRADCDALTQLFNRRALHAHGAELLEQCRVGGKPLAIIFIDLDNFKRLNDQHGHGLGDMALCAASQALLHASRSQDLLARLGGDEFALLLPDVDLPSATSAAERLRAAVRRSLARFDGLSASVGVAWFERPDRSLAELLAEADDQLLRAKRAGKDTAVVKAYGPAKPDREAG